MSVLESIVQRTRQRLAESPPHLEALCARVEDMNQALPPLDVLAALRAPGHRIIAELKRHSPSLGALAPDADPFAVATAYADAGAAAISVLTEPERFGGSFADLDAVSRLVHPRGVPTLCKDFVVDPRQVLMARAHGASLVLLIVRALDDQALVSLREQIESLGMQALVETHDAHEIARAVATGARIIGVNSRNLDTLVIDLAVAEALRAAIPADRIAIAESGIESSAHVARLARSGYRHFLVGSSLMRHADPAALLRELINAEGLAEPGSPRSDSHPDVRSP
ncbi:MAG: indole-3-glycerol-phosphate synthase [Deltaproteobacteria bacterium]|nr:indole-3-glycerol-phosphate synthase [Deltaproteobacteria bacterium]